MPSRSQGISRLLVAIPGQGGCEPALLIPTHCLRSLPGFESLISWWVLDLVPFPFFKNTGFERGA